MHVLVEHRGVKRVVLEAAAHEKRATTSQDWSHDGHVQVNACRNVGRHQAVFVEHIGQQQVVDVGAVAGYVDHSVVLCRFLGYPNVVDGNAVVDPVPEPGQYQLQEANSDNRHAGGDLVGVFVGLGADLLRRDIILRSSLTDGFLDRLGAYQPLHQGASMRQIRPQHRLAYTTEVGSQNSRQLAVGLLFVVAILVHHLPE